MLLLALNAAKKEDKKNKETRCLYSLNSSTFFFHYALNHIFAASFTLTHSHAYSKQIKTWHATEYSTSLNVHFEVLHTVQRTARYLNEMIFLNNISTKVVVCNNTVQMSAVTHKHLMHWLAGFNHISSHFRCVCVCVFFRIKAHFIYKLFSMVKKRLINIDTWISSDEM